MTISFTCTTSYIGILSLHLDKESYERAGIVGKPEGVKGGRGTKPRWGKIQYKSSQTCIDR